MLGKNKYLPLIQTNASVHQGNSGGPLVSSETGKLIGINTGVLAAFGTFFFQIKLTYVTGRIQAFPRIRSVDKPALATQT